MFIVAFLFSSNFFLYKKSYFGEFPGGPGLGFCASLKGGQVHSLVQELRSCMVQQKNKGLFSGKKKKKKRIQWSWCTHSIVMKTWKNTLWCWPGCGWNPTSITSWVCLSSTSLGLLSFIHKMGIITFLYRIVVRFTEPKAIIQWMVIITPKYSGIKWWS